MAEHIHSEACCKVPPVIATKEYKLQGKFENIGGWKTYVTGPATATKGIFVIFDVFSYWPSTLQGADILATHDGEHEYRVFMPDILEGEVAEVSWFPPHDDYTREHLGAFLGGPANSDKNASKVPQILSELQKFAPNITKWGLHGYCWGGKMTSLNSASGTPFSAASQSHPAFLDPSEALNISIPMCLLPSMDEDVEIVKQYMANLKGPKHVETFSDMIHGWMSAKGDLEDPHKKEEYERGYKILVEFYGQYL